MKQSIIPYKEIRDKLCTFTIVNCISRKFPYNLIGHTAVLYKSLETGQLMVLESTTLNKFTGISGVQMMAFGVWLDNYDGKVYVRIPELFCNPSDPNKRANKGEYHMMLDCAQEFIKNHLGTSYPNLKTRTGRFKLYLAALDFKLFGRDWFTYTGDDDGIFCTQLVVMLYQYCGLCADPQLHKPAYEYEPDDMRGDWGFENVLNNCTLGYEIRLK